MNLPETIIEAEVKHLKILESFFMREWGETILWSHNISHHRRVWNFAKELLQNQGTGEAVEDPIFIEKLMIACFLHDIGMAIDSGVRHGQHSMALCSKFLNEYNIKFNDSTDLLLAVKMHDEKDYRKSPADNRLLQMLSIADDLDAFGYVGIYRYLEIYLIRGTSPLELGYKILMNARSRFDNFKNYFGVDSIIVANHLKRYIMLEEFFDGYNKQIKNVNTNDDSFTQYYSVVNTISENSKNGRTAYDLLHHSTEKVPDPILREFIINLGSELK